MKVPIYSLKQKVFRNRGQAKEHVVMEKLNRSEESRLAKECAKLDINFERRTAEEGFAEDVKTWPEY